MERFPILRLVLRFGRVGAMVLSFAAAVLAVCLVWSSAGPLALLTFPPALVISYVLLKSYVEIIQIISEMAH